MKKQVMALNVLIILCFFAFGSRAQTTGKVVKVIVTDSDYYAFYNNTINPYPVGTMSKACNPDSLPVCNLISTPEYNALRDDTTEIFMDSTFSKADRGYIREQMIRERKFRWKAGEIKNVNIIDGEKVKRLFDSLGVEDGWKAYYPIYKMGYNKFSIPFFSCDKQKCIVYRGYECGMSYGLGNTNAFEKRDGKWILIKSCAPWVH